MNSGMVADSKITNILFRNTSASPKNYPLWRCHLLTFDENMFSNPAVRKKQNDQPLTDEYCTEVKKTKSGRLIKMPDRLIL